MLCVCVFFVSLMCTSGHLIKKSVSPATASDGEGEFCDHSVALVSMPVDLTNVSLAMQRSEGPAADFEATLDWHLQALDVRTSYDTRVARCMHFAEDVLLLHLCIESWFPVFCRLS